MRFLAGTIALGLALLRPSWNEGTLALPGGQPGAWLSLLERALPQRAVHVEPPEKESCSCLCQPLPLDLSEQVSWLLCGFLLWPALDHIWLLRLAWQRWVWSWVRVLQVRPPDRP